MVTSWALSRNRLPMLDIPESHDVHAAATIGYPKLKLHSVPQRDSRIRVIG